MTFFYDLNKKLKEVAEQPKSVHQQLNEGAKPDFLDVDKDGNKKESFKKAVADKKKSDVDEGMFDSLKAGMAKAGKAVGKALTGPSDQELIADLQDRMYPDLKKVGKAAMQTPAEPKPMAKPRTPITKEEYGPLEEENPDYSAKKARAGKDIGKPGKAFAKIAKGAAERYGSKERGEKVAGAVLAKLRAKESAGEVEEGWDDMIKAVDKRRGEMKKGEKVAGHKGEIEKTEKGIKHTRRYDDKTGETDTGDNDTPKGEKRRGRPKGTGKSMGAKGPSGKSKLMTKEAIDEAIAALEEAGYAVSKLDEKAVSQQQQKFMGMVHAMQKGEKVKGASPELKKVARTMKKSDAEDFAATKHKGLPKKKTKEVEETADETPKASKGGMTFGKGIYDSMNREIEQMIAESMSINLSTDTEGHKNITVTASDEDAVKLAAVLKLAGVGSEHAAEPCPACGSTDCGCNSAEQVDENQPDWPTDEVESDDALQYAGGLNKPKTDVAGDGQTTVPVTAVRVSEEAEEELDEQEQVMAPESIEEAQEMCEVCEATPCKCDESVEESLARFRSLAGIQETKKVEEDDMEEGNKFTGNLAKARAAGKTEADLDGDGDLEKVKESVGRLNNLWKAYKG